MRSVAGCAVAAALWLAGAGGAAAQDAVHGRWATPGVSAIVELAPCRDPAALCGTIRWLWDPVDERGRPRRDAQNAETGLRARPLLGLEILSGLRTGREDGWVGRVYNPEDGQTYSATVRTRGADTLLVEGCVLVFCQKQVWRRASVIAAALH